MPSDSSLFTSDQERRQLQQALRECEILRELSELLASSFDLTHILNVLVKRTTEVCEVERCAVWLFEEAKSLFVPKTYFLSTPNIHPKVIKAGDRLWYPYTLPLQNAFVQRLIQGDGIIAVDDLHATLGMKAFAEKFLVQSILFIALRREGRVVGILSLDSPSRTEAFSEDKQQLVRAIGQQAAVAIDNARLYRQAQNESKRAERLIKRAQSIYEVAIAVNSNEDLSTVLGIATRHLVNGLEADGGTITLLDNGALLLASTTTPQSHIPTSPPLIDLPRCSEALLDETPRFFTQDQMAGIEKEWYQQFGLNNVLVIPLIAGARNGGKRKKKNALLLEEKHCVGFAFPGKRASQATLASILDEKQTGTQITDQERHQNDWQAALPTSTRGSSLLQDEAQRRDLGMHVSSTAASFGPQLSQVFERAGILSMLHNTVHFNALVIMCCAGLVCRGLTRGSSGEDGS